MLFAFSKSVGRATSLSHGTIQLGEESMIVILLLLLLLHLLFNLLVFVSFDRNWMYCSC